MRIYTPLPSYYTTHNAVKSDILVKSELGVYVCMNAMYICYGSRAAVEGHSAFSSVTSDTDPPHASAQSAPEQFRIRGREDEGRRPPKPRCFRGF